MCAVMTVTFDPYDFSKVPNVVEVPTTALLRDFELYIHLDPAPIFSHAHMKRLVNISQEMNDEFESIGCGVGYFPFGRHQLRGEVGDGASIAHVLDTVGTDTVPLIIKGAFAVAL